MCELVPAVAKQKENNIKNKRNTSNRWMELSWQLKLNKHDSIQTQQNKVLVL